VVTLTVVDDATNCTSTTFETITVGAINSLMGELTLTPGPCNNVMIDVSDDFIAAFPDLTFDYGDGQSGRGFNYMYAESGTFIVTVIGVDNLTSCMNTIEGSVTVETMDLDIDINSISAGCNSVMLTEIPDTLNLDMLDDTLEMPVIFFIDTIEWGEENRLEELTEDEIVMAFETRTYPYETSGNFTVTISGFVDGCPVEIIEEVTASSLPPEGTNPIYVPNAFTPDITGNDDFNNVLSVNQIPLNGEAGCVIQEVLSFQIYNRWGKRVYASDSIVRFDDDDDEEEEEVVGWNGTDESSDPTNPDPNDFDYTASVYRYVVEVIFVGGSPATLRGNVTLIR